MKYSSYIISIVSLGLLLLPRTDYCYTLTSFKGATDIRNETILESTMCEKIAERGNYRINSSQDSQFSFDSDILSAYASYKRLITYYGIRIHNETANNGTSLTFCDIRDLSLIHQLLEKKIFDRCHVTSQKVKIYNTQNGLRIYIKAANGSIELLRSRNSTLYKISYTGSVKESRILSQILYLERICEESWNACNNVSIPERYRYYRNEIRQNGDKGAPPVKSYIDVGTYKRKVAMEVIGYCVPHARNGKIMVDIFNLNYLYKIAEALMTGSLDGWQLNHQRDQTSINITNNSQGKKVVTLYTMHLDTNTTGLIKCHIYGVDDKVDIAFHAKNFKVCVSGVRCLVKKHVLIYKIKLARGIIYAPAAYMYLRLLKRC